MPSLKCVHVEAERGGKEAGIVGGHENARTKLQKPLSYSGLLDKYTHQDLTPVIGREFEGLQVTDLLDGSDEAIRDLAITSTSNKRIANFMALTGACSLPARCRVLAGPECNARADGYLDASHYQAGRMCRYLQFIAIPCANLPSARFLRSACSPFD
jgi:hypothetical protein